MLQPSETWSDKPRVSSLVVFVAAAAAVVAGLMRYAEQPSFWLDEAVIAASLLERSVGAIFGQLEYGQLFPRVYLAMIAVVRDAFGYQTWSLRLLPFLSFAAATLMWGRLLMARSRGTLPVAVLAAALLIGSTFWLDQAIQLKQYTFEVMLALIPFLVSDASFEKPLLHGKRTWLLALLALPVFLSYTYPMALGARLFGWYVDRGRREGWGVNIKAVVVLAVAAAIALAGVWATDYRFNLLDRDAYLAYWNDCILRLALEQGPGETLRLIAKYLWGWHGRQPMVTAAIAPLQMLGVYSLLRRLKKREAASDGGWGSRSVGSLVLIAGVMLASILVSFPICAGRLVLFTQVHLQILTVEGALFLFGLSKKGRAAVVALWIIALVTLFHSERAYARYLAADTPENLRPMLVLMKPEIASAVWVHPCSVAQVRTLPEGLPVQRVYLGGEGPLPASGERLWVIWTHLGSDDCVSQMEQIRSRARTWQVIHEGAGRGLALAEF